MRRDRNRDLFGLSLLVLLLAGAGAALRGAGHERADLTFTNGTEPQSLDPAVVSGVPEGRILRGLFEGLTVPDPKTLEPRPGMAESWEISPDGSTYRFHIRRGAVWSDGSPFTAEDFRWSWERVLKPETAAKYAQLLWYVKNGKAFYDGRIKDFSQVGIRTEGPYVFVVELEKPTGFFLKLTSFYPLFPVHRATVEAHPHDWHQPEHLVCNGPFVLAERRIRDRIRLVRNERYWDRAHVRLRTIDILPVEDSGTALNLYMTGMVDWITDVPNHVVQDLMKRPDFDPAPYFGTYFYRINLKNRDPAKRRFLGDRRVRLALSLAMDRRAIVERVTRSGQLPADSFVPPGVVGYERAKLPPADPERARRLLAEALADLGLREPPSFTILYNTSEAHKDIAEVLQSQWRRVLGIDVKLENQEWGTYLDSQKSLDYDVCRAAWIGDYLDPNTFLDMWVTGSGNNNTGYSRPEYDRLIAEANAEADPAKRMRILHRAEEMLLHDLPIIPIYFYATRYMVRPWVKGFHRNPLNVHPLKDIWIDEELRRRSEAR